MFRFNSFGKMLIAISFVVVASGCDTVRNQGGGRDQVHLEDSVVTAKVKEAIANDPGLKKNQIDVSTRSGEVVLRGHVDSPQDVYKAAEVVNKVEGVQSLLNLLSDK